MAMARGPALAAALGALALMAACSDGGGDGADAASYDDYMDDLDAIAQRGASLGLSDPSELPTSGAASFDGVIGFNTVGSPSSGDIPLDVLGDLELRADFGTDSISGSADEFVTSGNEPLGGSLDISNGAIFRAVDVTEFYTYGFDLTGTLVRENGASLAVSAGGVGDFFGAGQQQAGGLIDGVISTSTDAALIEGGFIAER